MNLTLTQSNNKVIINPTELNSNNPHSIKIISFFKNKPNLQVRDNKAPIKSRTPYNTGFFIK